MKSMTGYAYSEATQTDMTVSVEIKSYNSRFLDLTINQPYWLSRLEIRLREFAKNRILRGKVEISIRIREKTAKLHVTSDPEAARAYMGAVTEIADALGHSDIIPLSLIIEQEGVLTSERSFDIELYWNSILPVLESAFIDFENSRLNEGNALKTDVISMIERIEANSQIIANWIPEMEKLFKDTIKNKFEELLGNNIDEQRVMQETAALLVRYTINEEVVRLRAHLVSLRKEIEDNPAPGRKADFICQEINREVNTIGSKNQILEVGQSVIDAKDALENIREQMRNIE